MFDNVENLWVVHIGQAKEVAERARAEGFVAIGWTELGDLERYDTRPKMRGHFEATYPAWSPAKVSASFGQVFRFAREMKVGDPVLLPLKAKRTIAIGRVAGPCEYWRHDHHLVAADRAYVRRVEWLKDAERREFSQQALYSFGSALTVSTSNDHLDEVRLVLSGAGAVAPSPKTNGLGTGLEEDDFEVEREETGAEAVRQQTEDYLIKAWTRTTYDFEELTAAVFRAMGYHATVTQASGDHGVDVIAHKDPLGVMPPTLKIQCKSGASTIGGKDARELKGSLSDNQKGILISLGGFARQAEEIARNTPDIVLIDGQRFVSLFLDHYDELDAAWRTRYPLVRAFVPAR